MSNNIKQCRCSCTTSWFALDPAREQPFFGTKFVRNKYSDKSCPNLCGGVLCLCGGGQFRRLLLSHLYLMWHLFLCGGVLFLCELGGPLLRHLCPPLSPSCPLWQHGQMPFAAQQSLYQTIVSSLLWHEEGKSLLICVKWRSTIFAKYGIAFHRKTALA